MVHGDAVRETEKANRYDLNNCQPLTRYRGIAHAKKIMSKCRLLTQNCFLKNMNLIRGRLKKKLCNNQSIQVNQL